MRLVLFATYGSSLESWRDDGILDRELALYADHAANDITVDFISFGGPRDWEIAADYSWLTVHCNDKRLHPRLYAWLVPVLHRRILRTADLFKTNQLFGAHIARRCARLWGKPLLVRQGYGYYEHRVEEYGADSRPARRALSYERRALRSADGIVFTTDDLAQRAIQRHGLADERVRVLPNYIVPADWTPTFEPIAIGDRLRLVFFGRFTEQKNLESLIDAAAGRQVSLTLIGEGPLEESLRSRAQDRQATCCFMGRLPQSALKPILQESDAFVLPSHYEGHPKALLEAMTFGMPVLAADSPGIRGQVVHERTGLLVPPTADGLGDGINKLANLSTEVRRSLGEAARAWCLAHYAVEAIAKQERLLFDDILAPH